MTEERGRLKSKQAFEKTMDEKAAADASANERSTSFKARKMPTYKFFEVAKASENTANAKQP